MKSNLQFCSLKIIKLRKKVGLVEIVVGRLIDDDGVRMRAAE